MTPKDVDEVQFVANLKSPEKPHYDGFHVAYCGCWVHGFYSDDSSEIHAMITIAAGDRVKPR